MLLDTVKYEEESPEVTIPHSTWPSALVYILEGTLGQSQPICGTGEFDL